MNDYPLDLQLGPSTSPFHQGSHTYADFWVTARFEGTPFTILNILI